VGPADSLQPATVGTAPTSGAQIRSSNCRNRNNERVADQRLGRLDVAALASLAHDEGGDRPNYADHSAVVTPLTSTFTVTLGIIR